MRHILIIMLFGLLGGQGCDDEFVSGPISPEPIRINEPDSLIILLPSDTTIPIEIEMTLPNPVDSLSGAYQIEQAAFVPLVNKNYPDTSNNEFYNGDFTVPDSLENGTMIRLFFRAFDVEDSTYLKTLRIDIENE